MTLAEARQRHCLSTRELAGLARVAPVTIWRTEKAKHQPLPRVRRQLAEALGVSWDQIDWPPARRGNA